MSYEQFVMRSVRQQRAPRTLNEAFRDADYGTALWRCETATERGANMLLWLVTTLFVGFVVGVFLAPVLS